MDKMNKRKVGHKMRRKITKINNVILYEYKINIEQNAEQCKSLTKHACFEKIGIHIFFKKHNRKIIRLIFL